MTIVQYGMSRLGRKVLDLKKLIRVLVIIHGDAKKSDVPEDVVKAFIAEADTTSTRFEDPQILLPLWLKYKNRGGLIDEKPNRGRDSVDTE